MTDHPAHLVVPGPQIEVVGQRTSKETRLREHALMAAELKQSPAWPWLVEQLEQKALEQERQLVDPNRFVEPRAEDRMRGLIGAYRSVPRIVEGVLVAFDQAVKQAKQQQEQQ